MFRTALTQIRTSRVAESLLLGLLTVFLLAAWRLGHPSVSRKRSVTTNPPMTVGRIDVHPSRELGEISPLIYGTGIEWTDDGNGIFDRNRGTVRSDVLDALKPLRIPVIRFPGGILADHYQWRDGVGPRDRRPHRKNPMDEKDHANNFGTDEFIEVCRALQSDALITVNAGTGSLDDAIEWQKYFKSKQFPVKFWEIGNEIYLAEPRRSATIAGNDLRIYKTPAEYADLFSQWSDALRSQDPAALVGAIAGTFNTSGQNKGWLDVLLSRAGAKIDFLALHNSFAPMIFSKYNFNDPEKRENVYRAMFTAPVFAALDTRKVEARLHDFRDNAWIAITEHFPLFGAGDHEQLLAGLDQSRTLASALYTATAFHNFMREGVRMANYNLTTSKWFGALLTNTNDVWVKTPTYYLWDLYRNQFGITLVKVDLSSPTFMSPAVGVVAPKDDVPYLDAVGSKDRQGMLYLAVVNRSLAEPVPAIIAVEGLSDGAQAQVTVLNGPAANAINGTSLTGTTLSGPLDNVRLQTTSWKTASAPYTFPPHSVTVLKWSSK